MRRRWRGRAVVPPMRKVASAGGLIHPQPTWRAALAQGRPACACRRRPRGLDFCVDLVRTYPRTYEEEPTFINTLRGPRKPFCSLFTREYVRLSGRRFF